MIDIKKKKIIVKNVWCIIFKKSDWYNGILKQYMALWKEQF